MNKNKKIIIILAVALALALIVIVIVILVYSVGYIFRPVASLFVDGEEFLSFEIEYDIRRELSESGGPSESKTVILEGEDCDAFGEILKGVKVYYETSLSRLDFKGINFNTIDIKAQVK